MNRSDASTDGEAWLPISEVSRRTGISVAGLRNWEQRYGLPRPQRSPSGRRRYREADCDLLAEVLRRRDGGMSLSAAMAQAATRAADAGEGGEQSIFAGLRRQHPDLPVHVLSKETLLAVTWAIEDECGARARRPLLVGSFQRQRFFRASAARWTDLASAAEHAVVFADFERNRFGHGPLTEIAVPEDSPMRREWAMICDAPDASACVTAWERPGQDQSRDRERVFEALWSVDPQVVRTAARIGAGLATAALPQLGDQLSSLLREDAPASSADLRRASGVIGRTLDYLDQPHQPRR